MARQAFDTVINRAFLAMLVIYAIVAGLGYYYFGDAASVLITDDLAINSPFTGRSVRMVSTSRQCLKSHSFVATCSTHSHNSMIQLRCTLLCVQILIPGFTVDKLVSLCILVNAYTTYPCLVLVIQARLALPLLPGCMHPDCCRRDTRLCKLHMCRHACVVT